MQVTKDLILIWCVLTGSAAFAEPVKDHFYLDGVYMFNVTSTANTTDFEFTESNGLALFGGYRINSAFTMELGGIAFDTIKSLESTPSSNIHTEYQVTGYSFGIRGIAPVGKLFNVWAGAGVFQWDSVFNYSIDYPSFPELHRSGSNSHSGQDYYLRLGVTHPLTDSLDVTLESMQMKLSDFFANTEQNNTDFDQNYIGLGINWHF